MVKQGTIVKVNGKQAMVETSWGAGAHRVFKLNDGRQILDLDKLVADGRATVVSIAAPIIADSKAPETKKWIV